MPEDVEEKVRVLASVLVENLVRLEDGDEGSLSGTEAGECRANWSAIRGPSPC